MTRPRGVTIVAIIVFLLGVNAFAQVARVALGWDTNPTVLVLWQFEIGTLAFIAAAATWLDKRWAPSAIVLYGLSTATMIVALRPILELDADAQGGLIAGGVAALAMSLAMAWYVRRALRRMPPTTA